MRILLGLLIMLAVPFKAQAQEAYHNPVDGKDYIAHWETYTAQPDASIKSDKTFSDKVKNEGVVLLSAQSDFEEIGVKPLGDYILSIQNVIAKQAQSSTDTGQIIIQVELSNNSPKVSGSYKGNISQELLQSISDEIEKIPALETKTKGKTLLFQVTFSISSPAHTPK